MKNILVTMMAMFLGMLSSGCGADMALADATTQGLTATESVYHPKTLRVPQDQMVELDADTIAGIGGHIVSGDPKAFIKVDYASGNGLITGGVFEVTKGVVQITFPFTEHATVLNGRFISTNMDTGEVHTFGPGDSYIIEAGATVQWDVVTPRMQKSFMNVVTVPME